METIAVTGVSGYVGSCLLHRLETEGQVRQVIGLDLRPPARTYQKLTFLRHDIRQPFGHLLAPYRPDSAVHLAFVLRPRHDSEAVRQTDLGGTQSFLEACREAGVNHVVYLSSHTVYGAHPDNPVPLTEESPLRPMPGFQYSSDKAEVEALVRHFAATSGVPTAIMRACVILGPGADNNITRSLFKPILVRVRGYDPPMQFLHEEDLAELMVAALRRRLSGTFNVAGERAFPYSEMARLSRKKTVALPYSLLRLLLALSWKLRLQEESPSAGLDFIRFPIVLSTEKLRQEAGFQPRYSSRDALLAFLESRRRAR